jgi:hypothetical protein
MMHVTLLQYVCFYYCMKTEWEWTYLLGAYL